MMDRKSIKKNMDIISAFAEDKVIQIINEKGEWVDLTERDGLPIETIAEDPNSFRIKPEPKYRPFNHTEECWQEMQKHSPLGWVKLKVSGKYFILKAVGDFFATVGLNNRPTDYNELFEEYTFADGVPFGVKVEE